MVNITFSDNHREERLNKRYNRLKYMYRLGKYKTYWFGVRKGKIVTRTFKHDKFKSNFKKDIILKSRKLRGNNIDLIKHGIPLPVTKKSKIVGVFRPKRKGGYITKERVYQTKYYTDLLISRLDKTWSNFREENTVRVFPGSFSKVTNVLAKYCQESKTGGFSTEDLLDGYFSRVGIDLYLPKLGKFDPKLILGIDVNPKSSPGIISSQVVGQQRQHTTRYSKPIAYNYCKEIMDHKTYTVDKSLWKLGGREKRVIVNRYLDKEVNKELGTRAIWQPEDVPTLINQTLCKSIMVPLQIMNKGFNYSGRINGRKNFLKLINQLSPKTPYDINFGCDYSKHDAHITERSIVTAYSMLRLCFDESDEIDKLFYYSMSSMIFKRVVLPESNLVYEIAKGIPSGHGLTSILTTICAYGNQSAGLLRSIIKRGSQKDNIGLDFDSFISKELNNTYLVNAGDDVIGKISIFDAEEMYNQISGRGGMEMDNISDNCGYLSSCNPDTSVTFLKKKYSCNLFSWNNEELWVNLVFPTMKSLSFGDISSSLKQVSIAAPYDLNLNSIILSLIVLQRYTQYLRSIKRGQRNKDPTKEVTSEVINFINYVTKGVDQNSCSHIYKRLLTYNYIKGSVYMDFPFNSYTEYDIKSEITETVVNFREEIAVKWRLLSLHQPFESHIIKHRLDVFDTNKKFIKAIGFC